MKKLYYILLSVILLSCSESDIDKEAELVSKSTVQTEPGFEWFLGEYESYLPQENLITNVNSDFDQEEKLVIFIKPSCECRGNQKDFPRLVKSLDAASVAESKYEIYTMREDYSHPYMDMITITDLPQAYILKNGAVKYSIFDSLLVNGNPDSLKVDQDRVEYYLSESVKD